MLASTGAQELMFRMAGEESQEKTVASKPVSEEEFPAVASAVEQINHPYQRGWTVQIKPFPGSECAPGLNDKEAWPGRGGQGAKRGELSTIQERRQHTGAQGCRDVRGEAA